MDELAVPSAADGPKFESTSAHLSLQKFKTWSMVTVP